MIDESSQSSSVSSGLHDSSHSDFKEGDAGYVISGDCREIEREASIDREIETAEVFAATVEDYSENSEEIVEMECSSDLEPLEKKEEEDLLNKDGGSVEGVVFLSNLDSTEDYVTEECKGMAGSSDDGVDVSINDVTTCQSLEWDGSSGGNPTVNNNETKSLPSFTPRESPEEQPNECANPESEPMTSRDVSNNPQDCLSPIFSGNNTKEFVRTPTSSSSSSKRSSGGGVMVLNKDLCPPPSPPPTDLPRMGQRGSLGSQDTAPASSIMNESYYIATKDCSLFQDLSGEKRDTGQEKKGGGGGHFSRQFEKLENTLKRRKKHKRGSPSRHTVGVDAGWLRKLAGGGIGSRKSVGSVSPEGEDLKVKEEKVKSPRKGFPLLPLAATGKALRERLRGLGSPLRATSEPKSVIMDASPRSNHAGSLPPPLDIERPQWIGKSVDIPPGREMEPKRQPIDGNCVVSGATTGKRSSSESPSRDRSWSVDCRMPVAHAASESDVDRGRGERLVIAGGEQGKVKMRNRISSGSKIQSIV